MQVIPLQMLKKLQLSQLNKKLLSLSSLVSVNPPDAGWIRMIRLSIGMTMNQLGKKLGVSRQAVLDIEKREMEGAISIKTLREVGKALDMKLVYGFIPIDGSVEALVDRKSKELATEIVMRTSQNMALEDQENSDERLRRAIEERTNEIKNKLPKALWD